MDRSRHSRCFRMSCPSRHRSRQTPQHKSRLPSRSMCTSMCSSVSSTLVTVWAFRRSCFLIKVSMSNSFGPFVVLGQETAKINRCGVLLKPRQSTTSSIQRASTAITLLGQEPRIPVEVQFVLFKRFVVQDQDHFASFAFLEIGYKAQDIANRSEER